MGFLDFLKKNKPVEAPPAPPPKPEEPFSADVAQDAVAQPPVPPAPDIDEIRRKLGLDEDVHEEAPAAPQSPPAEADAAAEAARSMPAKPMELPDFTDEDIAALERSVKAQPPAPKAPEHEWMPPAVPTPIPAPIVEQVKRELAPPEPPVQEKPPAPAPAKELPGVRPLAGLEPAMFISGDEYLTISDGIRGVRRLLRKNDDLLRTATAAHEQTDEQLGRIAADINAVQERLMELDGALFEG